MIDQLKPPTAEVLNRVRMIKSSMSGTAFIIERNSKQYLITAAHLLEPSDRPQVQFMMCREWIDYPCELINRDEAEDIAILKMPELVPLQHLPVSIGCAGLVYGQFVYFLGYPFMRYGETKVFWNGELPLPYVKRAVVSQFDFKAGDSLILDGYNNEGFSGGPVVFVNGEDRAMICGLISGFQENQKFVEDISSEQGTGLLYRENTGLIATAGAVPIIKLIDSNPDGFPL